MSKVLHGQDCHFHCSELRYHRNAVNWSFHNSWNNGNYSFSQGQSKLNDTEQWKRKPFSQCFAVTPPAGYFPSSSNIEAFPMLLETLHPRSRAADEPLCCVEEGTGSLCLFVFTCQIVVVWQRCFPTSLLLPLLYSGFFFVIFTQKYKLFGMP